MADALAGGKVRQFYRELQKRPEDRLSPSGDLQKLLAHAAATTGFYKAYQGCTDIRSYPIVTKSILRENYDRFVSSSFREKSLHVMRTSGTGGERFAVLQNREKRKRVLAELIYYNEQCGFFLGDRYIYSRVWFPDNQKSRLVRLAENMLPLDCSLFSDQSLQSLALLLQKDSSIRILKSYASSLGAVADYFEKMGFSSDLFNLKVIISGAERLDPPVKGRLKKIFGCPVVSRYSNQENGILAQQSTQGDEFYLNTAHYFFECLQPDQDKPAPAGQPARLIVTDLHNRAMPFIRYDTGDVVIAGESMAGGETLPVLTDISGRQSEIIQDTRGNRISPHYVALGFRQFERIRQYQLIQESRTEFTLKVENRDSVPGDEDLRTFLRHLLGEDASIDIVHMEQIPRAASGKLKKMICNLEIPG